MLDKKFVGLEVEIDRIVEVEKGHIRKFAEAIGDPNPLYRDEEAARAAGYASIPAPPTFPISFSFEITGGVREQMPIDMKRVLHGEQSFSYKRPLVAGDKLRFKQRVVDINTKEGKSGGMDLLTIDTIGYDEAGAEVLTMRGVTVIRH